MSKPEEKRGKTSSKKKIPVGKKTVSSKIINYADGYWEWFMRVDEPPYEIAGKYLLFSNNRELLAAIALEELETGSFHRSKTHMENIKPPSGEYVLCLYYKDDSRKLELADKY